MLFDCFVDKYNLKKKATSSKKIEQVLLSLSLNDVGIYLQTRPFLTDIKIVNLHPPKKLIGMYTVLRFILIVMVVHILRNYLISL